jgi:hypothetical protein
MKTPEELKSNPWADAHKYADSKYHMEKGDHISKYERYEEVKEAFEAGYRQALEDYADKLNKQDNENKRRNRTVSFESC